MVTNSEESILGGLIGLSYESALEPTKWSEFLKQIVPTANARSAFLRLVDVRAADVGFFETIGYDANWAAAYRNHFVRLDPYLATWTRQPVGLLVSTESVVGLAERRNTEYHNDYERPQDIKEGLGCILGRSDGYDLQFALQRGGRSTLGFLEDTRCMRLLKPLMPHLARSVQIQRRLAKATEQRSGALEVLHRLRAGVILTDRRGYPYFVNRAAEQLMAACPGVNVGREGLQLRRPGDTAQLERMIGEAKRILDGEIAVVHDCLSIPLPNGELLQIQVTPLISERTSCGSDIVPGSLAFFISRPGQQYLSAQKLMRLYGLTRAEARLAAALAQGQSLEEISSVFGISIATVRTQLNAVFGKTGTRRQPELVALLLSSVLAYLTTDNAGDDQ